MALKALYDHEDDIPEEHRSLYSERDGKFVLDIEGIETHPGATALKNALDRQKTANRTLTADLAAARARLEGLPDDFNADEFERLRAFHAEHEGDDRDGRNKDAVQNLKAIHDQRVASLQTKHTKDLQARDDLVAKKDATIKKLLADDGLTKALIDAGVAPKFMRAAKALLKESVKVEEEDGEYTAVVSTEAGPVEIPKFVAEWVQGDEGREFVAKTTGGDANGSNGRRLGENPWDTQGGKVRPNLTKQQEYITANPEKARQLAKAAGVVPTW